MRQDVDSLFRVILKSSGRKTWAPIGVKAWTESRQTSKGTVDVSKVTDLEGKLYNLFRIIAYFQYMSGKQAQDLLEELDG